MAFASEIGKSPKVAYVIFCVGSFGGLLNLIGYASPYWMEFTFRSETATVTSDVGLWQACQQTLFGSLCATFPYVGGKFAAAQAMMTLGLMGSLATFALLILFLVTSQFKIRNVTIFILLACIGIAMFNVIGIALFAVESQRIAQVLAGINLNIELAVNLHWAFYLCCVGTFSFVLSAILAVLLVSKMRNLN